MSSYYYGIKKYYKGKMPLQAHTHLKKTSKIHIGGKRMYSSHLPDNDLGSITVEAALVLPIILFAALFIYNMGYLWCVRTIVYEAMQETVQYAAEYAYLYDVMESGKTENENTGNEKIQNNESSGEIMENMTGIAVCYEKMSEYIDDTALVEKYIENGIDGIVVSRFELSSADNHIYMNIKYKMSVDIPFFGEHKVNVKEQICQKAYLGTSIASEYENVKYVYIAENESVYHLTRKCSHINPSIKNIDANTLNYLYENLTPCEICVNDTRKRDVLYITDEGLRYHNSRCCRGLKRTVYRVEKEACKNLEACSKCGK